MRLNQKASRKTILVSIAGVLAWILYLKNFETSQRKNLRLIEAHIAVIQADWRKLQSQKPDLKGIHLFAYTGSDGMLAASGDYTNELSLLTLSNFLAGTKPPRPLKLDFVRLTDPEEPRMREAAKANRR